MIYPDQHTFLKLAKQGNLIPLYQTIILDTDTPVSVYYKLCARSRYGFLLESVEGKEKMAQYSFVGKNPQLLFKAHDTDVEVLDFTKNSDEPEVSHKTFQNSPLDVIREWLAQFQYVDIEGLPRFSGGLVGFLSYDMVRYFERLPDQTHDDLNLPVMMMIQTRDLVLFDHRNHHVKLITNVHLPDDSDKSALINIYNEACERLSLMSTELAAPLATGGRFEADHKELSEVEPQWTSNISQSQFLTVVEETKKDIRNGEIIQGVLSQRLTSDLNTDPFNVYRSLRILNPSPYMFYLNFDDFQLVGSSPELLVRCEDGVVETRPIAGTRPRGKDEAEDAALADDLLNDPKERAEHIMLVDLGRNDLGRVCENGTVHVNEFMLVENYSHVMHIVSNVKGQLNPRYDCLDVLEAAFPAGTVSGAPKIRAMEIIDRLENTRRGPYAGCIGYLSFSGNLDTCITIRTIVITNNKAYVQAGAGIVADSDPQKEYEETLNKAKAQLKAIQLAHLI